MNRPAFYAVWLVTLSGLSTTAIGADTISCLGRIEPVSGVILLAGPSGVSGGPPVISQLKVSEGDWVEQGQILAILDDHTLRSAEVARQSELVEDASIRLERQKSLSSNKLTSEAKLDEARYELRALQADKAIFEARREMSLVRAPLRAQILEIYTYPGEKVGSEGVMELGNTEQMAVIAEVYETDIKQVKVGQVVSITSPALNQTVSGTVSSIGYKVGKLDVLGIDPIARTDARVVEATIVVEDSGPLERLTNLQVDVEIHL